jgi:hypothetical protein
LLIKEDQIDKQEIKNVIKWLQRHCKDKYIPRVRHYSPDHIRKKWDQFYDAMIRYITDKKNYMNLTSFEYELLERIEDEEDERREKEYEND